MKTIHVSVTEEDLRVGVRGHQCFCAVARAVDRALGLPIDLMRGCMIPIPMCSVPGYGTIGLPGWVSGRIIAWDKGEHVDPFEFDLTLQEAE